MTFSSRLPFLLRILDMNLQCTAAAGKTCEDPVGTLDSVCCLELVEGCDQRLTGSGSRSLARSAQTRLAHPHHLQTTTTSMSEKRRAELELKRAKLAELRKAKADREAERRAVEVRACPMLYYGTAEHLLGRPQREYRLRRAKVAKELMIS